MKKGFYFFEIVFYCFLIFGCSPSPEELILKYQQAHNRHNIYNTMSYYTDDAEFEITGTWIKKGKAEIRKLEEWDASVEGYLNLENFQTKEGVVTCSGKETNKWFKLAGIDTVYYDEINFTLHNNKISRIKAKMNSTTYQEIQSAIISVINWASVQKPDVISSLMPDNKFEYSYENGKTWIKLLKEWKMAKE